MFLQWSKLLNDWTGLDTLQQCWQMGGKMSLFIIIIIIIIIIIQGICRGIHLQCFDDVTLNMTYKVITAWGDKVAQLLKR